MSTKFNIKLLAGKNVVMLESPNFESELFTPTIVNGRLSFVNIIPNRRCCDYTSVVERKPLLTIQQNLPRNDISHKPLANSTPLRNYFVKGEKAASMGVEESSGEPSLPSPEPVRRAMIPQPAEPLNDILARRGIKVVKLHRFPTNDGTPRKLGRLVSSSSRLGLTAADWSLLSQRNDMSNIGGKPASSPTCPSKTHNNNGKEVGFTSTPINKRISLPMFTSSGKRLKCRTPIRTYAKLKPIKYKPHNYSKKYIPGYLINPTKHPQATHRVKYIKKKLQIDNKIFITPRTFKKQTGMVSRPEPPRSTLPKNKKQLEIFRQNAFDMLTNSNRPIIAAQLNDQFRKRCVNKASSTYPKYKLLCSIPKLQQDMQVLEITRSTNNSYDNESSLSTSKDQLARGEPIVTTKEKLAQGQAILIRSRKDQLATTSNPPIFKKPIPR